MLNCLTLRSGWKYNASEERKSNEGSKSTTIRTDLSDQCELSILSTVYDRLLVMSGVRQEPAKEYPTLAGYNEEKAAVNLVRML